MYEGVIGVSLLRLKEGTRRNDLAASAKDLNLRRK